MAPQQRTHDRLPVILSGDTSDVGQQKDLKCLHNAPAKGVPFFVPAQNPAPGTGLEGPEGGPLPKLFTPLKIRGIEMPNRIWVSPMCQYSAHEGFQSPWHYTHYGGMAQRGVSIIASDSIGCYSGSDYDLARIDDGGGHRRSG